MKAVCPREGLLSACQLASAAVSPREVKPILRNLKAIAQDGRCTLLATDLELGIRLDVLGLTIQEPGEAILPAKKLIDILREARDTELTIEADSNACMVRGKSLFYEMPSEDPAQFPEWPSSVDDSYHEISAGSLREMIRRTAFAAADETGRYTMTGVLFELEESTLRLIATDGRRLAFTQGTATGHGGHSTVGQTPVVPAKTVALLERNLQDEGETVKICIRPNDVLFRTERAVIYSRLVEGRFPDYRQALPKKQAAQALLNAADFQAGVRQAAIMTEDESKRVTFAFDNGKLTLEAHGSQSGRSQVEMPVKFDGSKPVKINFNPAFLIEMLKVLPANAELTLDLIDGASPALFRYGEDYKYLVMPLT